MTDHMEDAVEAGAYRLLWKFEDLPHGTRGQVAPYVTETHREWAEDIITAAEPHLRKKWAEEIREGVNPPDTGKAHEWRRGFITGVLRTARFLEGVEE